MFYFEVFKAFYQEKVKYLVVGGLAVNLHGVPRITYDIDIIIPTDRDNVLKLNRTLRALGYVPRLPVNPDDMADEKTLKDWIENRNMRAFSFYHKKEHTKVVDIVLEHPLDFTEAFRRSAMKKVGDIEIYVASIDDMIAMKKVSNRPKDLSDMEMLKEALKIMEQKNE
ncbi:MAG: hypothetical protein HRF42_04120 [Candidatus Brocadia sp.]|jgi:hypothetical protein